MNLFKEQLLTFLDEINSGNVCIELFSLRFHFQEKMTEKEILTKFKVFLESKYDNFTGRELIEKSLESNTETINIVKGYIVQKLKLTPSRVNEIFNKVWFNSWDNPQDIEENKENIRLWFNLLIKIADKY